ncbi:MAG: NUDIX domain-containing protein, partial [Acidimicrobiales bacterium]
MSERGRPTSVAIGGSRAGVPSGGTRADAGPEAGVLAVGAVLERDGCLLLVRRAHPPGQGLWSLPGGRVEPGES